MLNMECILRLTTRRSCCSQAPGDDGFRYFDINGPADDAAIVEGGAPGVSGVFRDSAGAAVVALMYADLPGVDADNSHWARCMAMQTVNYMLGSNAEQFSYVTGFGYALTVSVCLVVFWCLTVSAFGMPRCGKELSDSRIRACESVKVLVSLQERISSESVP
jgi:hypothetical protein